ncbi:site-specific DNA-methyltransferase, partial [Candidatus Bathyarchaeota archaeon]|nr:site-specific DNA-methyltransferase [Candidatus Bathyarchaeota archaeon]
MSLPLNKIIRGDCREVMRTFPKESIDLVIYSPPYYGLRDYSEKAITVWNDGWRGQLGLEPDWRMYIQHLVEINREVKRVLKKTGSLYVVIGDTYAGSHCGRGDKTLFQNFRRAKVAESMYQKSSPQEKATGYRPKCLMGIPWRFAFAMIEDGWILRNAIIWGKGNAMPESVKDRLSKKYEYVFHFVKSRRYYYNLDMIREEPRTWIELLIRDVKPFGKRGTTAHRIAPVWESYGVKHDFAVGRIRASYRDPLHLKERFLRGLKLVYEEMKKSGFEYDSK